jgi:DNA-binding transcriptional regulator YhcF (GntR family)
MTVLIDPASEVPPFEQVRSQLAQQINDGRLPVGTRLTTVRRFAEDLGIAPNTVARAYRELEAAGLLETRGRAGTFVGSNGDSSRAAAAAAAADYVRVIDELGISRAEGLAIVAAGLEH